MRYARDRRYRPEVGPPPSLWCWSSITKTVFRADEADLDAFLVGAKFVGHIEGCWVWKATTGPTDPPHFTLEVTARHQMDAAKALAKAAYKVYYSER